MTCRITAIGLCLVLLAGCTKPMKPEEEVVEYPQWMTRYEVLLSYQPWPEANVEDAGLTGPGGNFAEAWAGRAEAQKSKNWRETFNLSSQELAAMSTRNLVRTCYIHPYNTDFLAFEDDYEGILTVFGRFNGWQELMRRKQASEELLLLFKELNPPGVVGDLYTPLDYTEYQNAYFSYWGIDCLSLVIATAVDYHRFSRGQVAQLAADVEKKISVMSGNAELYSYIGHIRLLFLLGSFLAWHYDGSLSETDRQTLSNYLDPYSLWDEYQVSHIAGVPIKKDPLTDDWIPDQDALQKATEIIAGSLSRLKSY